MKANRVCETLLAGVLALGTACPLVAAAVPVPRPKPVAAAVLPVPVEAQLAAAQGQIVAGNLDAGLKTLALVRAKAPPALAPRIAFVEKLVAVRVADRLNDQAKVAAGLIEAFSQKFSAQPDQAAACWQLGLNLAQAAVAAKSPAAAGLTDVLGKSLAPALRQFGPHLEMAKLRMAAGQVAAAEAELTQAAARIASPADRTAWTAAVADLAKLVDGGQAPQAGVDLFARLRKAAPALPVQLALDVAEARALLARGELSAAADAVKRAAAAAKTAKADALPALTVSYELAAAWNRAGKADAAKAALADAEAMAQALPPALATPARCSGLAAGGHADLAADVAWTAALSARQPVERQKLLALYVPAAVAAGRDGEIVAQLKAMKAPAGSFTSAAVGLAQAGKAEAALSALEAATPQAIAADAKAAGDVAVVVARLRQQHQQTAARQAASCRAVAAEYAAVAKKAQAAKDVKAAAAATRQAAAFQALAAQVLK